MARSTVDDMREILAYYKIQEQDRAREQWQQKMRELHDKRAKMNGGGAPQSMYVPQPAP